MNIKFKVFFLNALLIIPIAAGGMFNFPAGGAGSSLMPGGSSGDALFPMPTPEEMAEIEKFLETLSPEEMDELVKIGEQIIKEAEAEGRPLFPNMPMPQPPVAKPVEAPKPPEPVEPNDTKTTEKKLDKEKIQKSLKQTIITLLEVISTLRQKAETDERYLLHLNHITPSINILVYYLHVMRDSKHIAHLADEAFAPLKNEIFALKDDLEGLVKNLVIPTPVAHKKLTKLERDKRRNAIITAEILVQQCSVRLEDSIKTKKIVDECEKLLKKYEPEAVKLKEDQAKRAKLASEQSGRLPMTNTAKQIQMPSYATKTAQYSTPARGSSTGTTIASSYGNDKSHGHDGGSFGGGSGSRKVTGGKPGTAGAKGTAGEDKKEGEKSKPAAPNEVEKAKNKMDEEFSKLHAQIKRTDMTIRAKKEPIKQFLENPGVTKESNPGLVRSADEAFEEINFELDAAKDAYESWSKKVKEYAKMSGGGNKENKKALNNYKKIVEAEAKNLAEFGEYLNTVYEGTDIPEEKTDEYASDVATFNKHYNKITEKIKEETEEPKADKKSNKKKLVKKSTDQIITNDTTRDQPSAIEAPADQSQQLPLFDKSAYELEN